MSLWKVTHIDTDGQPHVLHTLAAGAVCHTGQVIADFRHTPAILESGTPPHEDDSSGSVQTDRGSFYPKVYHLRWTKEAV